MNIINYFYNSQPKLSQPPSPPPPQVPPQNTKPIKQNSKIVYLVLNKNSQVPLGIYNTLELAKSNGQKSTYNNCSIIEYKINQKCTFLNNPIFEDN